MANPILRDSDMEKCIKNCLSCARVCLETLHHCLSKKGFNGTHIQILQACVDTCQLSAKMMIADLRFHHQSCELCFEVCSACATECERFGEDPQMLHCAEVCRRCAESCRSMAGMTVSVKTSTREQFSSSQF